MRYAVRFACTTLLLLAPFAYFNNSIASIRTASSTQNSAQAEAATNMTGLVVIDSTYSVEETANRLEATLVENGLTIFNRINHAEGAAQVGEILRPTQLIIFGNPQAGTALMQCDQRVAIDLPQKALIWQDEAGQVKLAYNDPEYLATRHSLTGCEQVLENISSALNNVTNLAVQAEI